VERLAKDVADRRYRTSGHVPALSGVRHQKPHNVDQDIGRLGPPLEVAVLLHRRGRASRSVPRNSELFSKALGPDADLKREEHLLTGDTRCVYRVRLRSQVS